MYWTDADRFGHLWREFERMSRLFPDLSTPFSRVAEFPPVNVWSDGNEAVVTAELPGINPADADISVVGKTLTIKGVRKHDDPGGDGSFHRQERWTGSFSRTIDLPFQIDQGNVEARFSKGVLEIKLPRAEADKPKRITIATH